MAGDLCLDPTVAANLGQPLSGQTLFANMEPVGGIPDPAVHFDVSNWLVPGGWDGVTAAT